MNNNHDYPPEWDELEITEAPEFAGLLTKNAEGLFTKAGVRDDFVEMLFNEQPDDLGKSVITAMLELIHDFNCNRKTFDVDYAMDIFGKLKELKLEMAGIAEKCVLEETKQELVEIWREELAEQQIAAAGF